MKATQATISATALVLLLGLAAGCTPSTPQPIPSDDSTSSGGVSTVAPPSPTGTGPDPVSPTDIGADPTDHASSGIGGDPAEAAPTSSPSATGETSAPAPVQPEPDASEKSSVTPTIVYAGAGSDLRITVNGFVPEIVEAGGTCTAALEGTTITASSPAVPDASTTWCEEIVIDRPVGDPADWRIVLSYTSPTHQGSSTPTPVSAS